MTHATSNSAYLEHANLTVSNPEETAALLCDLFDWHIRWAGPSLDNGRSIHVGNESNGESYLALYTHPQTSKPTDRNHFLAANLNHIAIVVDDLDKTEARVIAKGLVPFNHADYEPGRRFYFYMPDDIEVEVVSYRM